MLCICYTAKLYSTLLSPPIKRFISSVCSCSRFPIFNFLIFKLYFKGNYRLQDYKVQGLRTSSYCIVLYVKTKQTTNDLKNKWCNDTIHYSILCSLDFGRARAMANNIEIAFVHLHCGLVPKYLKPGFDATTQKNTKKTKKKKKKKKKFNK